MVVSWALFLWSFCSATSTLSPPCSSFAPTGVIATDLLHDLKPCRSHLPTSGGLFAVVDPSMSCSGPRNEVLMEANKTQDSLDIHELPIFDTRTNRTYNKTEFIRESRGTRKERKKQSPRRQWQESVFPHTALITKCSTTVSCNKDVIAQRTESPD